MHVTYKEIRLHYVTGAEALQKNASLRIDHSPLTDEDLFDNELGKLTAWVYDDNRVDPCMDSLMDELYTIYMREQEDIDNGTYDSGANAHEYMQLFNIVLPCRMMCQQYFCFP